MQNKFTGSPSKQKQKKFPMLAPSMNRSFNHFQEMPPKRIKTSSHSASSTPGPGVPSNAPPTLATILCIPELKELVIAYLTVQERGRLLLANKYMFSELLPFLWRVIPSAAAGRLPNIPILGKYIHFIQFIDFSKAALAPMLLFSEAALNSKSIQQSNDDLIWASGTIHRLKISDRLPKEEQPQQPYGLRRLCFLRACSYLGPKIVREKWPLQDESPDEYPTAREEGVYFHQYCRVLRTSPRLTHLAVPSNILLKKHDNCQRLFLSMLTKSHLPYLQSLIVASDHSYCSESISMNVGLMLLCRALELKDLVELRCGFELLFCKTTGEVTSAKEEKLQEERAKTFMNCLTTLQTREPDRIPRKLKTLQLPNTLWPLKFLVPFFTSCVEGLERLSVPWLSRVNKEEDIEKLVNAIKGSCPSIQHIEAFMTLMLKDGCDIRRSIQAVVQVATGGHGLISFETYDISWHETHLHHLLVHQTTLERVVSYCNSHDNNAGLMKIMGTCPNLKVVHAPWFLTEFHGQEMIDATLSWKCKGLTALCMTMGDPDGTTAAKSTHYSALGQLTQLQDLTLGYSPKNMLIEEEEPSFTDLQLEDRLADGLQGGYLGLLGGLKELRRLYLRQDFWTCLTMTEIKFMAKNWPCLESITFVTEDVEFVKRYLEVIACWKKLKVLRPGIEYRVIHLLFIGEF